MSCSKWLFQHPNDIFIETGSGAGGGIDHSILYGFKEIHSIEIDKSKYDYCVKKYAKNKSVHLYCGDSMVVLPKILSNIKTKATFLLDAHVMNVNQLHGEKVCPVLEELKIIIAHSKKIGCKHSILIDDAKFFNGSFDAFGHISLSDIKKLVGELDSSYVIQYGRKSISVV